LTDPGPGFGERLARAIDEKRSCLVVGLDPVLERVPRDVLARVGAGASGGEGMTARAAAAFGFFLSGVIDAVADLAVAVKPNTAFFERYGAAGWECLVETCRHARKAGLLVIADAKRGDIGHTAEAYADALLGTLPDTPGPHVDAVTVSPYLGADGITPFLDRARALGKGIFVLVRTSNPSAAEVQDVETGGAPLYLRIAGLVGEWGKGLDPPRSHPGEAAGFGPVGAVVGATAPEQARRIREALPRSFFLVPGYGAQGAGPAELEPCFLPGGRGAVVNASRSILFAHEKAGGDWALAIREAAARARDELEALRTRA
jgi:orotidine-5'-phosphate decarboxylase